LDRGAAGDGFFNFTPFSLARLRLATSIRSASRASSSSVDESSAWRSLVISSWFNDESRSPVKSLYNNLIHVTDVAGASVFWDLTLRPNGIAEVRGHPTVWGWAMGENVIPVVEKCDENTQ